MNKQLISEYLAQPDYKNVVLAKYLKEKLSLTRSFLCSCSAEELSKIFAVIENVALHFMDQKLVNTFNTRKGQLKLKLKDDLSRLNRFFIGENEDFLLVKSIVDEVDPLNLLQNNASYTCYNKESEVLVSKIQRFTLNHITQKVRQVFSSAEPSVIQELSERITNAFKDGSIQKYIREKEEYITFISYTQSPNEILEINILTHGCDYHFLKKYDCLCDEGEHTYTISAFLLRLLCNELSVTSFDLDKCTPETYAASDYFEEFRCYKDGKEHILLIDRCGEKKIHLRHRRDLLL